MPKKKQLRPLFKTIEERDRWFSENADYFTLIRGAGFNRERHEAKTLADVEALAKTLLQKMDDPNARYLIYAVNGVSDAYVKTVHK